jgi:PHD/YefM family antitoxin component YafN of YafNO toxin-antitoxin module
MDADDWLKTIEKKLQVVQCNNREKVLFASHQLVGPVADWWDAYVEAHKEPESNNWQEFKNSFYSHHVPLGVMKLKEFKDLKQGLMSVSEYVTLFTLLSCYAPDNMGTNEKKQDCFLNGLNDGRAYALEARDFINFQDMMDKALVLENRRGIMERKRKMQRTRSQGSNTRFRVGSSSQGPVSDLVSRVDSQECKLQVKDFKLLNDRFSAPTSNLLALRRRHHRGTIMHKILVLWDRATVVV